MIAPYIELIPTLYWNTHAPFAKIINSEIDLAIMKHRLICFSHTKNNQKLCHQATDKGHSR